VAEQIPAYDVHRPYADSRGTWCVSDDMAWPCEVASAYAAGLAAGRTAAAADIRAMPYSDDRFEQRRTVVMQCARVAENGADR
jgi:hypothetical protein